MSRQILSIEEHRQVAIEILVLIESCSRILSIINGKVPAKVIDQLITWSKLNKSIDKLRNDLSLELARRHPHIDSLSFYESPNTTAIDK